jgi:hypothetical protein
LAVPVGLKPEQVDSVIERVLRAFESKSNIPELVMAGTTPQPLGAVHANYKLVKYHRVAEGGVAGSDPTSAASKK